jgi:phospholipid/cholesterol/gamma-HCH transport system ATP-binding protein
MMTPALPTEAPIPTMEPRSKPVIVFDDVSIAFEENVVLDGISFSLPHGETKAIFGVAGSGKSTILKMALGLVKPDSGHLYTLGEDVTQMT